MVYFLFIAGFVLLIFGARWFVDGAASIGARLGLSPMLIGLTIVSVGTSFPELAINVFASAREQTDLAISNVIGSNIINILLIIGITAGITPLTIRRETPFREIPVSLGATLLILLLAVNFFVHGHPVSRLSRLDGAILLVLLIFYLYFSFKMGGADTEKEQRGVSLPATRSIVLVGAGVAAIFFSSRWIVDGTHSIAVAFGIGDSEVGLFIVAMATSLPELVTSVTAALRKQADIAIGNALGSCIMNIFLILGLSALITPLPLHQQSHFDIIILVAANLLLFAFVFIGRGRRIDRWEGLLMVAFYIGYVVVRLTHP